LASYDDKKNHKKFRIKAHTMINSGFVSLFCVVICVSLPWFKLQNQLLLVAIGSMFGVYVVGSRDNLETFHLPPGPIIGLCFCLVWVIKNTASRNAAKFDFTGIRYLLILSVYSLLITCISPVLFEGKIFVIRPNAIASQIREAQPISWTTSSIAQSGYLFMSLIMVLAGVKLGGKEVGRLDKVPNVLLKIGVFFSITVILEAIISLLGADFRFWDLLMAENLGDTRPPSPDVNVGGLSLRRAVTVFTEASTYSTFMLGCVGASIIQFRWQPSFQNGLIIIIILFAIELAFSTTAIIGSFIISMVAMGPRLKTEFRQTRQNIFIKFLPLVGALFLLLFLSATLLSDDYYKFVIGKIFDSDGYEEGNYSSAAERAYWNNVSFQAFLDSYGLGCGAGATRASSFLVSFVSSFGIIGIVSIGFVILEVLEVLYKSRDAVILSSALMWCGWFVGLSIANPDGVSLFYFWILFGLILAMKRVNAEFNKTPRVMFK
jgi:hypothetical protein